ncbi:hypothetical protein [Nitrospirillum iridis]|uniref:Glycosyltransferase RgtA/B/C/D-like domain-containing protein n=1 Tax=Nitrospirillum iridis TaxID=765888 RepID=A0A7X0ATJ7_9PROT|nr:hypothetical protein [Nitrospirillum iridis]MBB6249859.1 hypothetical protein [Nitrospirillum iridis]
MEDAAADILLSEKMHHAILLTGHYNFMGIYHPGPFFFYVRGLFEFLAPAVGSIFLAHIIGMMVIEAGFFSLTAAILLRLTQAEGIGRAAALAGIWAIPLQLSGSESYATLFVPSLLPLPLTALIAATVLTMRGSAAGLVATTLLTCILVHAYLPVVPVAVGLWGFALVCGRRARRHVHPAGFPMATYGICAGIIGLFILPMALDAILFPPGNIIAILKAAFAHSNGNRPSMAYAAALALGKGWLPRDIMIPVLLTGVWLAVRRHRLRRLWRETVLVGGLTTILGIAALSRSPVEPSAYMAQFMTAPLLMVLTLSITTLVAELSDIPGWPAQHRLGWISAGALFILTMALSDVSTNARWFSANVDPLPAAIAARSRPGDLIAIANAHSHEHSIAQTLLVRLERFGVQSCLDDEAVPEADRKGAIVAVTRERACSNAARKPNQFYRVEAVAPCPPKAGPSYRAQDLGYRAVMTVSGWLGHPPASLSELVTCRDRPPPDAIIQHCVADRQCFTLVEVTRPAADRGDAGADTPP